MSSRRDRLRRESRRCRRRLASALCNLAGAPADLPQRLQIGGELAGFPRAASAGSTRCSSMKRPRYGGGHGPGVALVLDEAVHDRERAAAVAFDQFDRAEQRRRVLEFGMLDQEAADLDLRDECPR